MRTVDLDRLEELPQMPPSINSLTKFSRVGVIRGSGPLGVPTNQLMGKDPPILGPGIFNGLNWHASLATMKRSAVSWQRSTANT